VPNSEAAKDLHRWLDLIPVFTATGRLRGEASFTARHNTIFQGLAADGAKLALWRLWREGYTIALFVHDEIVIDLPDHLDANVHGARVRQIMIEEMQRVVEHVRVGVCIARHESWSKETATAIP
jgi:DNA polymerase I-like protein with 3'-5' exonuclease and polymerase domains